MEQEAALTTTGRPESAPPPCGVCDAWEGFRERRTDGEASRRPPGVADAERLGPCTDDDEVVRCPTCRAPWLHGRSRDQEAGTTDEALRRLERAEAARWLFAALRRYPWEERAAIERALDELLGPPPPLDALLPRARPGDDEALYQLARRGPGAAAATPALLGHTDDELAARVLAAGGALSALTAAARRGHDAAVRALGRTGAAEAVSTLEALLRDGLDEAARSRLTGLDRHAAPMRVALSAVAALARLGAGAATLAACVEGGPVPEAREAAALALGRLRDVRALLRLLRADDWSVRRRAAQGLALARPPTPEVVAGLREAALHGGHGPPIARAAAVRALVALGVDRDLVAEVVRAAEAHPAEVVRRTASALRDALEERP